jgi:transcriptional regulator with XRE-family HTH domain
MIIDAHRESVVQDGMTIREVRDELGLSPRAMADKLGVARTTYDSYERGHRPTPAAVLVRIADLGGVQGVALASLLRWAGTVRPAKPQAGAS